MSCELCETGKINIEIEAVVHGEIGVLSGEVECNYCPQCGRPFSSPKTLTLETDGRPTNFNRITASPEALAECLVCVSSEYDDGFKKLYFHDAEGLLHESYDEAFKATLAWLNLPAGSDEVESNG